MMHSLHAAHPSTCSKAAQRPSYPPPAALAAAQHARRRRNVSGGGGVVLCQSAASSPASSTNSRRASRVPPAAQQHQQHHQPLEPRIQVSINTNSGGVAKAVLLRLQQLGHVEVWATSAANHFTAVAGLGLAAQQLQQAPLELPPQQPGQQQQPRLLAGLAATAVMTAHDQPVKDDQKRRLNKLELQVVAAPQINPAVLAAGQPGSLSTNRTTSIAAVLDLMRQQLMEQQQQAMAASSTEAAAAAGVAGALSIGSVKQGAVCVVEARGEQAVTRALKAALSLQAAAGQPLLVRPVAGPVVDVVAEKRGQSALADGLLLVFSWA